MLVRVTRPFWLKGQLYAPGGEAIEVADRVGLDLLASNKATRVITKSSISGPMTTQTAPVLAQKPETDPALPRGAKNETPTAPAKPAAKSKLKGD